MLNVGTPELLLILIVALVVLGPKRLPEVARQLGKAMGEVRRFTANVQDEIEHAVHAPTEEHAARHHRGR
jgi:sec-independent protein translocase protein TatB